MLTMRAKYALKALVNLARRGGGPALIADIAGDEGLPRKFLEAILLELKKHGVLSSRVGRGGGYSLVPRPEDVTLLSIVRIADGPIALVPCVSETAYRRCDDCKSESACALRRVLKEVHAATAAILARTTLADLAASSTAAEELLAS